MGMANDSTHPRYFLKASTRREYVSVYLLCVFDVATEVSAESNFYENQGAKLLVEGGLAYSPSWGKPGRLWRI